MTEEQMLKDAAKATGRTILAIHECAVTAVNFAIIETRNDNGTVSTYTWSPQANDIDAFRLAVDLGISVSFGEDWTMAAKVHSFSSDIEDIDVTEDHDDHPDKYAATRVAITRAAAETGREADRQQ